jgi:hypothetical protein
MTEREDVRSGVAPRASEQDRAGGSPVEQRLTRLDTGRPDPMIPQDTDGRNRRKGADGVASGYDLRLPRPAKGATLSRNRRESGEYRLTMLISGMPRADL